MMRMKFGFTLALSLVLGFAARGQDAKPAGNGEASENNAPIGTAVVKGDTVNVRGQASFIGEVIGKLKKGDTVAVLEEITLKQPKKDEPTNWFRIPYPPNTSVWVFSDFLDKDGKTVKANRLNLRAGPGENYSIVGRLEKDDAVKVISTKGDWTEIEAPVGTYAFVAADLLEKHAAAPEVTAKPEPAPAPAPEPTPAPAPTPEPAPAPAETVEVPASEAVKPAEPAPAPPAEVAHPAPPIQAPAPVITSPAPAPEQELPKRIVKREGIVSRTVSIQAPTYFELESIDSGRVINYLNSPEEIQIDPKTKKKKVVPLIDLKEYLGKRIIVTGEESIDKRWPNTPVIKIETIDLVR